MPHLYAPTQLKPAGTRSFRLASSQLFDLGINSQNYDKESADIYEAPPGWSFFQRDQAGAEALVVAYEAKAGRYRALFENKLKPHTYVALHLFLDKFRKAHPRDRYWLRTAPELQALPEWAELSHYIQKKSKFEYDIGKRTGHACIAPGARVVVGNNMTAPIEEMPNIIECYNRRNNTWSLQKVTWNCYDYSGVLYKMGDLLYTPEHTVLYRHPTVKQFYVDTVETLYHIMDEVHLPLAYAANYATITSTIRPIKFTGKVYCPTTATGFFTVVNSYGECIYTGNSNYKMGPNTFREQALKESEGSLIMTFDEAKYYLDIYKQLFPEIVEWQIEIEHEIRTKRLLRNLFGFPRSFERLITDSYIREAISWIPQSTVGCITHRAYRATFDYVQAHKLPWRLVSNKHDSYAVLAPDSDQEHVRAIMAKHIGLHLVGKRGEFTMVSDFQVGKNLKKYHETENPLGMREL